MTELEKTGPELQDLTLSGHEDHTLLGNVLAIGSRLVAAGAIPKDVVEEAPGAYAICLVTRNGDEIRAIRTGEEVEVGRSPDASAGNWKIDDPWMSRRHFTVSVDADGRPWLRSLGAKNGTFLNDRAVEDRAALRRGDVVRAGDSSFLVL